MWWFGVSDPGHPNRLVRAFNPDGATSRVYEGTDVFVGEGGVVWVFTADALLRIEGASVRTLALAGPTSISGQDASGMVYGVTFDGIDDFSWRWDGIKQDGDPPLSAPPSFPSPCAWRSSDGILLFYQDRQGILWSYGTGGVSGFATGPEPWSAVGELSLLDGDYDGTA